MLAVCVEFRYHLIE